MNPSSLSEQQHHILFDRDVVGEIVPQWFDIEYWQDSAQVTSTSLGRGRAWFIEGKERSMVLRHYQRGGAMSRLLGDKYIWQGLENTRAWREWQLLAALWQQGLPVPQPLAAHVIRSGLFYRADLLTVKIPASRSLSDYLLAQPLPAINWQTIGQLVRRFHDANVCHADLNAHNILVNKKLELYFEGKLKPEEETRLIENSLTLVGNIKGFKGIETATITGDQSDYTLFDKVRQNLARILVGERDAITIIGPATVVKDIKRNPKKLELMLNNK